MFLPNSNGKSTYFVYENSDFNIVKLCYRIIQIIHTVGQKLYIPLSVYSKFHMIASTNPTQIFTAHVLACLHYRLNFGEDWWRIAKFLLVNFNIQDSFLNLNEKYQFHGKIISGSLGHIFFISNFP